jgi:hypothetical protein
MCRLLKERPSIISRNTRKDVMLTVIFFVDIEQDGEGEAVIYKFVEVH